MKYEVKTDLLNNGDTRWNVSDSKTGQLVGIGMHKFPGQARHDGMEYRRKRCDNPPLEQVVYDLYHAEDVVASELMDEQDKAEETVISDDLAFDDFSEQECKCGDNPQRVTCGKCHQEWCEKCDPAPSAMCHWCNGNGGPETPLRWGIVYPEHASPELDDAKSKIVELYELLEEFIHDRRT